MPTYRKRGKRWQAIVRVVGHDEEYRTFPTRAEAKGWGEDREDEIRRGVKAGVTGKTVADAMDRYAADVAPTHKGERWETLRLGKLKRDTALSSVRLDDLTGAHIASWRDRRLKDVKAASVRREWGLLRSVFEVARREWGWMASNPMAEVKRPEPPAHRDRRISDDEAQRIRSALGWDRDTVPVANLSQQVAVMFLLAIETAMRAGELSGLTWSTVDLERKFARLPKTKNGTAREVALSKRAVELFGFLPRESSGPLSKGSGPCFTVTPGTRDALFRRTRRAAGLDDLHFHDTRHEAITRLAKKLDVLDLARMVGHRDLRSLQIYYNATASEIAERLG